MLVSSRTTRRLLSGAFTALVLLAVGCQSTQHFTPPPDSQIARELNKVSLPEYIIEPPDLLQIDAQRTVPLPPYKIEALDTLLLKTAGRPDGETDLDGIVTVEPEGKINLGVDYGTVIVAGMTLDEAKAAIEKQLKLRGWKEPKALVAVAQSRGLQQIRGEHLVRPDGNVSMGSYGSVYVTGMTVPEAKAAIEKHLSKFMLNPEIALDVLAYNSKVYYIVTDGGGFGEQVVRLPVTGNECVLDALSQINGLPSQASKRHIWIARPAPAGSCKDQILEVDWNSIVKCGKTETNYQVLPGDRIYVRADGLIMADNWISKIVTPAERMFGVTILSQSAIRSFHPTTNGSTGSAGAAGGIGGFGGF